ncbi:MAG: hypothetical protein KDD61_14440 [Bdellovibrionales bacterium]|nr:hypothetical protein [Bdellovibrionales bacterium]
MLQGKQRRPIWKVPSKTAIACLKVLLFVLICLGVSTHAISQEKCVSTVGNQRHQKILGDLQPQRRKPFVRQCSGTCYFESYVSVLESVLSRHYGQTLAISRPHLFSLLILEKLRSGYLFGMGKLTYFSQTALEIDLISSGNRHYMRNLVNQKPLVLRGSKTQSQIYKEDLWMRQVHHQVAALLSLRMKERFPKGHRPTKEHYFAQLREILNEVLPEVEQILRERLAVFALESYLGTAKIFVKNDFFILSFEEISKNEFRMSEKTEQAVKDHLISGQEINLDYFHILPYVTIKDGRPGFLELPSDSTPLTFEQVMAKKLGGGHSIAVTDVILDGNGRIEYFVARNTWASRNKTDHGYHYISINYLHHYKADFVLSHFYLKTAEPINQSPRHAP